MPQSPQYQKSSPWKPITNNLQCSPKTINFSHPNTTETD